MMPDPIPAPSHLQRALAEAFRKALGHLRVIEGDQNGLWQSSLPSDWIDQILVAIMPVALSALAAPQYPGLDELLRWLRECREERDQLKQKLINIEKELVK